MSDSLRPHGLLSTRLLCPWNSPGKNIGVGCHALLQGIFPTYRSNLHLLQLLHCGRIPYRWANREAHIGNTDIEENSKLCLGEASCLWSFSQQTSTRDPSGTRHCAKVTKWMRKTQSSISGTYRPGGGQTHKYLSHPVINAVTQVT